MIPADSPLLAAMASDGLDQSPINDSISFSFAGAGMTLDVGNESGGVLDVRAWSNAQQMLVLDTLNYIETIIDVRFTQSQDLSTADWDFYQIDAFTDGTEGYTETADFSSGEFDLVFQTESLVVSEYTVIHEIGHALGMGHPFDGPANLPGVILPNDVDDLGLNSALTTRMAYNYPVSVLDPGLIITGESASFGAIDLAFLQLRYGADTQTGLGSTTYGISPDLITIWDNGGTDTIDFSAADEGAVIDLRPATLAAEIGGGGFLSFISKDNGALAEGGYTIAFGVEIEAGIGGVGHDILTGNDGANMLTGNAGDDEIIGGAGLDTALYSGNQRSYTVTLSTGAITVADRRADGDGTDALSEIEALKFGDDTSAPFALNTGTVGLNETQLESFIELYIAYFNRAPDAVGLNFWGNAFASGTTLTQTAALFVDQDETRALYADDLSNADFVTAVYGNVLGRQTDPVGFDFWVGVLDAISVTRDQFILAVLEGAKAPPPSDATEAFLAQQLADQQYLSIKTDIGAYYAVIKGLSDVEDATIAMAIFDGSISSRDAAQTAIDAYHNSALDAETGAFLMPLVGVLDDPFGGAIA